MQENKKSLLEFQMCDVPHLKSFSIMPLDSKKKGESLKTLGNIAQPTPVSLDTVTVHQIK